MRALAFAVRERAQAGRGNLHGRLSRCEASASVKDARMCLTKTKMAGPRWVSAAHKQFL